VDSGEPLRTPFSSLQSPVRRFDSDRRLDVFVEVKGDLDVPDPSSLWAITVRAEWAKTVRAEWAKTVRADSGDLQPL
jgi:hypothetical protein